MRNFFKNGFSSCSQFNSEHALARFCFEIDGSFDHEKVMQLSQEELSRKIIEQFVRMVHQKTHASAMSYEGKTDHRQVCENTENDSQEQKKPHENEGTVNERPKDSCLNAQSAPSKTLKGKSSLLLAISTFGYQILRYPHFAELCWVTSKLKEGPCADVTGPWKGWPFNSCIIRPGDSLQKVALSGGNSSTKSKEKFNLVRGLIAVGLSAYRGMYTSLKEVCFEVRKVLELLVAQINSKVQTGKDRYQYVRLLSQVAYLEDMVFGWAHALQRYFFQYCYSIIVLIISIMPLVPLIFTLD